MTFGALGGFLRTPKNPPGYGPGQSVTLICPAKMAETIELPFGSGLGWAQGTMYYMGS